MIDVLLPFYGDAGLLRLAVDSVRSQTDPRWRLHVVDDHYPDPRAAAWVGELDDPRIRFTRQPRNLGVGENFRFCLAGADAEVVTFLGCDDLLGPTYVSDVLAAYSRHPEAAIVQPAVRVIDQDGAPARPPADRVKAWLSPAGRRETVVGGEPLARSLMHGDWLYFPAIAWRRELIAGASFRPDMETVLDLALLMQLVLADHQFVLLEREAFSYRRHGASASSKTARDTRRFDEEGRLFSEVAHACAERGWPRAARAARWHLTSRLHAALLAPAALRHRDRPALRALTHHLFGVTPR